MPSNQTRFLNVIKDKVQCPQVPPLEDGMSEGGGFFMKRWECPIRLKCHCRTIPKTIFRVALFDSEDENDKKDTY